MQNTRCRWSSSMYCISDSAGRSTAKSSRCPMPHISPVLFVWAFVAAVSIMQQPCLAVQHTCDTEQQLVMCGLIPYSAAAERRTCCNLYSPTRYMHADAVRQDSSSTLVLVSRPDLVVPALNFSAGCVKYTQAYVPAFSGERQTSEVLNSVYQVVPQLTRAVIQNIKAKALAKLQEAANSTGMAAGSNWAARRQLSTTNAKSGLKHPGTYAGAAELAYMQHSLQAGFQPQTSALESLLTGIGVAPKVLDPLTGWAPPTDCSPDNYTGPYPMPVALIQYGGLNDAAAGNCAPNYPAGAPRQTCGHISFVELDGQMSYKQALAFWATGDVRHAQTALRIVGGWAATNKVFGPAMDGNGPLEAAWGCASFSRAMELLRHHPDWPAFSSEETYQPFVAWVNSTLLPLTDAWVAFKTPPAYWGYDGNVYANWHSSIAECSMAFGILTDDRPRYDKAVQLFHATVAGYLKWGRGKFATNRLIGESTETLRDIYHTLFGLGGLLQTAEMAWQQDDDLYSSNGHVLAAAMEVHARIINAGSNESLLPPNFKFFGSMPPPPEGCTWRINLGSQLWNAVNKTTGAWVADLNDGFKYVLGSGYLPTGFEVGYNHFAGRLGMSMPETAALLAANPVEYYVFHWGLGTLTHAGSAAALWRPGATDHNLCAPGGSGQLGGRYWGLKDETNSNGSGTAA